MSTVDSDLDGSRNAGLASRGTSDTYGTSGSDSYGSSGRGTTGGISGSNTYGTSGSDNYTSTGRTAGPHDSDLANKADPRGKSDLTGVNGRK